MSRPKMTTWTSDQPKSFLQAVSTDWLGHAFTLLAATGMRRGEALGLRWGDIDFDASQIAIVQTLNAVKGEIIIGEPKTAGSRRTLFVGDSAMQTLRAQRKQQAEERLRAGPAWSAGSDLVFLTELGEHEHPDHSSRRFKNLVTAADVPLIRLHDLRHTNATLSLKAGVHRMNRSGFHACWLV
ncbi:MAG: site-specific integrase [Ilumatobacter sp.]